MGENILRKLENLKMKDAKCAIIPKNTLKTMEKIIDKNNLEFLITFIRRRKLKGK